MKILLVYPQYPDTFWSFRHALKIVSKKAAFPPLGLLTVAAMLPAEWDKKLIDINITSLTDNDIRWADYVFISAMSVQRDSAQEVIDRCKVAGTKVVAGGPMFTTGHDEFAGVAHFVLDEAEVTLPLFIEDLKNGHPRHLYTSKERPDISQTPVPLWSLINMKKYACMNLQYSRGCPFNCEFCDIIVLNGHLPRTKNRTQIIAELDAIYNKGWRSGLFIVDDNFIGNKKKLKTETLPAITEWMKKRRYPFALNTEASINIADDDELMDMMVEAGFNRVFIGIETPNEESLVECNKSQNRNRDLVAAVRKIQNKGLEVQGGFIVGFDSDPVSIFKSQIHFIQNTGIVTAMVGLLNAPRGTRLYQRLLKENRLLKEMSGNNTDFSLNFIPTMNLETLINGYHNILHTIYSPKQYYDRVKTFLKEYHPPKRMKPRIDTSQISALFRLTWILGFQEKGRRYFWRLFVSTLFKYPRSLPLSLNLAGYGYHFRKIVEKYVKKPTTDTVSPGL